jgi:PBP1b-binding outer membrane lipoprotein LpoB
MKKLFAILAVAGFLTACSDGGTAEEAKGDSTSTAAPATTAPTGDSTTTATPDSATLKADSTKPAGDSATKH